VESPALLKLEMSWFRLEVGRGMLLLAAAWLAVLASLLPSFTFQLGPPSCNHNKPKKIGKGKKKCQYLKILHAILRKLKLEEHKNLTVTTESRAAIANISAHETTPGHTFSTADLILSITSNPLTEFRFGAAFFSPIKLDVSSRRMEPSHPYI
jgi:hypothetical protein